MSEFFCYKETSRKHHGENGQVSSVLFQTEDIFDSFPAVQVGFHNKYCIRIQILISLVHRLLLLQQKGILGEIENLMLRGKVVEQLKQEQRRKKKDSFLFLSFGSFFSCYAAISSVARCEMKIIFYLKVLNHKISRAALSEYQIHEATIIWGVQTFRHGITLRSILTRCWTIQGLLHYKVLHFTSAAWFQNLEICKDFAIVSVVS